MNISKHIISYPVSQGTQINVTVYVSDEQKTGIPFEGYWVLAISLEEVVEAYKDFEPDAKRLLNVIFLGAESFMLSSIHEYFSQCFENPSRWGLHVVNELLLFACDRVALMVSLFWHNNRLTRSCT